MIQGSTHIPKPLSQQPIAEGPSSWRAGLRKIGSSSAVPESSVGSLREPDSLARSASSSWLASDKKTSDVSLVPNCKSQASSGAAHP